MFVVIILVGNNFLFFIDCAQQFVIIGMMQSIWYFVSGLWFIEIKT